MEKERIGFIGLGVMGGPMAANVAKAGIPMTVYDAAGTAERAPAGAEIAGSVAEVAAAAELVLLSLPTVAASLSVSEEIVASNARRTRVVADTSTVGIETARRLHGRLGEAGIAYVDAPISGGKEGAQAGTVSVMYAGPADVLARLRPAFEGLGSNVFHVGEKPGQGQAMKSLNNYLALLSAFATSEALAFGDAMELDPGLMLDVLNVSTGRTFASAVILQEPVRQGICRAGFPASGVLKDVLTFTEGAHMVGSPTAIADRLEAVVRRFVDAGPGVDMAGCWPWTRAQTRADG